MAKQRIRDIKQGKVKDLSKENKQANTSQHAPLTLKIKAFITDTFMIAMPIMYIVIYFVFGSLHNISQDRFRGWQYIIPTLLIILTAFMIISKEGQTPGMKAYSLALRDLGNDNKPSNAKPAMVKILFRQTSSILSILLFGWITMFFRSDRRALHEILSGTTMIYTDDTKNNNI